MIRSRMLEHYNSWKVAMTVVVKSKLFHCLMYDNKGGGRMNDENLRCQHALGL